jgi:hypothetical protein
MTNKEALQSQTEYDNDNLLEKLLLDRGLTAGATYTAANEKDIDLAAAALYFTLAAHRTYEKGLSRLNIVEPNYLQCQKQS